MVVLLVLCATRWLLSQSWWWYACAVGWYLRRCLGYALPLDGVPALCQRSGSTMVPPSCLLGVSPVFFCVC